jgi:drug/metabolite transporter (DMT)-like permease
MPPSPSRTPGAHLGAVAQALFVTFLWSTSWVLIKIGLEDLDLRPLSFAGLRYVLAALVLLPFGIRALRARSGAPIDGALLRRVVIYGLLFVALAQGAQFAALAVLPATAVNLVLSTIPVAVAFIAVARRQEAPSAGQLAGVGLLIVGALLYFGPLDIGAAGLLGVGAAALCVAASAISAHLGRDLARDAMSRLGGPIGLTAISMAVGAIVLLAVGLVLEGMPLLDARGWAIIAWLGVVNTALAFTIWNHTLRMLTAVESSVVNNTMLIQIAILAVIFLGERLGVAQVAGLACAGAGALIVQLLPALRRRTAARALAANR